MKPDSPLKQLGRALINFPIYVFAWLVGLAIVVISDVTITGIALLGVFVGFATVDVFWGLAVFFAFYTILRLVGNVAQATNHGLSNIAASIRGRE